MVGMKSELRPLSLQYVNRLSDWIFVMTRWISYRLGEEETLWIPKGKRSKGTVEMTKRQSRNI